MAQCPSLAFQAKAVKSRDYLFENQDCIDFCKQKIIMRNIMTRNDRTSKNKILQKNKWSKIKQKFPVYGRPSPFLKFEARHGECLT